MAEEASSLQRVTLFAALSRAELDSLSASLRRRRFARNEVIFHKDDPGNCLFIVVTGAVKIALRSEDGREVILTRMGPGEHFGDLALFDGEPRSADAIALDPTELLVLPRDTFLQFVQSNSEASLSLLTTLAGWVRRLSETVEDAALLDVPARLARVLLRLSSEPDVASGSISQTPRLTQNDLAAMIGATRESINKWLSFYERQGVIRREKGSITVLKREDLERRSH